MSDVIGFGHNFTTKANQSDETFSVVSLTNVTKGGGVGGGGQVRKFVSLLFFMGGRM